MSVGMIALLINALQWPLISEMIIASALYLHIIIFARTAKDLFFSAYQKGLVSDWLFQLQHSYDMRNHNGESEA
jgi:hypothetical protein